MAFAGVLNVGTKKVQSKACGLLRWVLFSNDTYSGWISDRYQ